MAAWWAIPTAGIVGSLAGLATGIAVEHGASEEASEQLQLANEKLQAALNKAHQGTAETTSVEQPPPSHDDHKIFDRAAMVALPALGVIGGMTAMKAIDNDTPRSVHEDREKNDWSPRHDDSFQGQAIYEYGSPAQHEEHKDDGYDRGHTPRSVHHMTGGHDHGLDDDYSVYWDQRLTPTPLIQTQEIPHDTSSHTNRMPSHASHAGAGHAGHMMMEAATTEELAQFSDKIGKISRFR